MARALVASFPTTASSSASLLTRASSLPSHLALPSSRLSPPFVLHASSSSLLYSLPSLSALPSLSLFFSASLHLPKSFPPSFSSLTALRLHSSPYSLSHSAPSTSFLPPSSMRALAFLCDALQSSSTPPSLQRRASSRAPPFVDATKFGSYMSCVTLGSVNWYTNELLTPPTVARPRFSARPPCVDRLDDIPRSGYGMEHVLCVSGETAAHCRLPVRRFEPRTCCMRTQPFYCTLAFDSHGAFHVICFTSFARIFACSLAQSNDTSDALDRPAHIPRLILPTFPFSSTSPTTEIMDCLHTVQILFGPEVGGALQLRGRRWGM
ncbi:hypothetical protein B0H11DRAFT_2230012 [Mycena galericulata]|nr:hypothetical protein B0H11DRAFT_2230012 [Mycena galericulata]